MPKDKNARRIQRKKKDAQKKRAHEVRKETRKTQDLFEKMFTQRKYREATQNSSPLISRSIWSGIPQADAQDPFLLCGMEFVYLTYPDKAAKDSWEKEDRVSLISLEEYLGTFQTNHPGVCHGYKGVMVQNVDPDSSYGELLTQQEHEGEFAEDEKYDVFRQRNVHFILHVKKPTNEEAKVFRRNNARVPQFMLKNVVIPLTPFSLVEDSISDELFEQHSLFEALSDPEVDRIWEFSTAVSKWISNSTFSLEMRKKEKASRERELSELQPLLEQAQFEYDVQDGLQQAAEALLCEVKAAKCSADDALERLQNAHVIDLSRIDLQIKKLEDEKRDTREHKMSLLEKARNEGRNSQLQTRVIELQSREKEIPEDLSLLKQERTSAEESFEHNIQKLKLAAVLAENQLTNATVQHSSSNEAYEKAAENLLKLERKARCLKNQLSYY